MSAAACPLCGGAGPFAFEKKGYIHHECTACGTWFVSPVPSPEALAAFYLDDAGEQSSRVCWEGTSRHAHASWRRALVDAERLAGRGPLLDVGCGAGQFLAFARERGWDELTGIELSPAVASVARGRTGACVHETRLEDAPLASGRFAAITAWDVLEHLADPRRALERAHDLLLPGGVLALGTPHRNGLTLRAFGERALLVMPPEHLFLATVSGLREAARGAGLEVVRIVTVDVHLRQWTSWARRERPAAAATPARDDPSETSAGGRAAFMATYRRVTGSAAFDAVQATANALLRALRLGDQIVAVFRRPARS